MNCVICGKELEHEPTREAKDHYEDEGYESPQVCSNECYDKLTEVCGDCDYSNDCQGDLDDCIFEFERNKNEQININRQINKRCRN